jgi:tetratricopeptide (TPR) repeat protein
MFTVTFYSYKGGVGRTLALVNVAFRLADKGKRVFILDFDLEAPGIDSFRLAGDREPRQGVVEYAAQFSVEGKVPDLGEYVFEVDAARTQPGRILVMPAGRKDKNYQVQLSRFDWKQFYRQKSGYLFVENLKGAIRENCNPDYVLVDSRTGLTDIAGICTLQLPDVVVLLFNLNNQNIDGIAQIYRSIRFNKLSRNIETILVASPLPDVPAQLDILKERLEYAKQTIGAGPKATLPFDPFMAFEERILPKEDEGSRLGRAYNRLVDEIISANKGDVLTLVRDARRLREQGNIELATVMYQELIEAKPKDLEALVEYGLFLKMQKNTKEAVRHFERAYELNPRDTRVLYNLATAHLALREAKEARKYLTEFLEADPKTEEVPSLGKAFENAGLLDGAMEAYQRWNGISETAAGHLEIGNLFMRMKRPDEAVPHYQRGSQLETIYVLPCAYNCGYALGLLNDPGAVEYFKRSIQLFEGMDLGYQTPGVQANYFQAMSHAYAGVGEIEKARQALEKALGLAKQLSARMPIYSSIQYKLIPHDQFIEESHELLRRLAELRS